MEPAQLPSNEEARLKVLARLDLLKPGRDARFQRYARLARAVAEVPIAAVSVLTDKEQLLRGLCGMERDRTPREFSFCGHAILQEGVFYIPDATLDRRFADNPLVTGDPNIRFYAGCPIFLGEHLGAGTLCVIDRVPRELTTSQMASLRDLADCLQQELLADIRIRALEHELLVTRDELIKAA